METAWRSDADCWTVFSTTASSNCHDSLTNNLISSLNLTIYYEYPAYYIYNPHIANNTSIDTDGDGYYETLSFDISIDPDVDMGTSQVSAKITCVETGETFLIPAWTINLADSGDSRMVYFDNTKLHFTGKKNLNFKAQLFDATGAVPLTESEPILGGPIKVDSVADVVPCPSISSLTTNTSTIVPTAGGVATVTGTVNANYYTWTLNVAGRVLANGNQSNAITAVWNGKDAAGFALKPDTYSAALTVTNFNNTCSVVQSVPITITGAANNTPSAGLKCQEIHSAADVASGGVFHEQQLFAAGGGALATAIDLSYNSLSPADKPLGLGWSHSYAIRLETQSNGSVTLVDGGANRVYKLNLDGSYESPPGDHSTLVKSGGTFTLSYRNGLKYAFDTLGRLASITDRFNNVVTFNNATANRTVITDPAGRISTIDYSSTTGRIATITDPSLQVYNFEYHPATNRLWKVIYPAPVSGGARPTWVYLYNAAGLLEYKTDPEGRTVKYVYDAEHRLQNTIEPDGVIDTNGTVISAGHTKSFAYNPATGVTSYTEENGAVFTFSYDSVKGVLLNKTDPNVNAVTYTYYDDGNIKTKTEPVDATTQYKTTYLYDSFGNVTDVTGRAKVSGVDAPVDLHLVYGYDYNNADQLSRITDYLASPAAVTSIVYDTDAGYKRITVTDPTAHATVTRLNANGTVHDVKDGNGLTTTYAYNADATLLSVLDPAGVKTEYLDYTAAGKPQTVKIYDNTGAVRQTTSLGYDLLGRLTSSTLTVASGTYVTKYGYDQLGNRTSVTDAENRETKYAVNFKGQVTKVTDALAKETKLDYTGGAGQVTSVIDANLNETSFAYYPTGKLKSETGPLGKRLLYSYYPSGNVQQKLRDSNNNGEVDAGDQVLLGYTYYPNGQLKQTTDHLTATVTDYAYWPTGKLKTAVNPNIAYSFAWYANGWPKSVTDTTNNRVITYNLYDGIGQKKQVTQLGEITNYDYDSQGRLWKIRSIADFNGKPFTFGYDELSRLRTLTYPNSAVTTAGYHPETGWLASLVTKNSSGVELINLGYATYDKVGNRKERSENGVASTYLYNELHQLTQATSGTSAENFAYDPVGNRKNGPTVKETEAAAYDELPLDNSMTQGRKYTYAYDDYGNRQYCYLDAGRSKYWQYTWDGENRLIQAELKKNSAVVRTVSFKYDPFGRRIEKKVVAGGVTETRTYVYDGEDIVFEYVAKTGATTRTIRYVHGPGIDQPLALLNNGQTYYYHADAQGSIVAITNTSQSVTQRYTYDAYGVPKAISVYSFENSYLFTGREWDKEIGLYYYRGRYYDPMEGRFISKDPIGFAGGDVNLYRYVLNRPTILIDPFGLDVTINIYRTGITSNSISGTINVTSTVTNTTFSGHTLENRNPPNANLPVTPRTYSAFMRTDHNPDRIELSNVSYATNVQIHNANYPSELEGCFGVGTTASTDYVGNSINAMNSINDIISADGTNNITVIVHGIPTGL